MFNQSVAYVYTLILSLFLAFHVRYFYNPDGAMLVMPFVYFTYVKFLHSKKIIYLMCHAVLLGSMIQFEMAIGIPFAILSFAYLGFTSYKDKNYKNLLWFLIVPFMQLNFIIFDLRHNFLITKLTLHFLSSAGRDHINLLSMVWQRILSMITPVEFSRANPFGINTFIMLAMLAAIIIRMRAGELVSEYRVFLYFYLGFFILSMGNAGGLLYFYVYPLFPLVFLMFASLVTSHHKKIFIVIFVLIYISNMVTAYQDMQIENGLAGTSSQSWAFYGTLAKQVFSQREQSFGYFTYDPDIVAYQPKYALLYVASHSLEHSYYLEKNPVTYLIIAYNLYAGEKFWTKKQLHIDRKPEQIFTYGNGYKVEKFALSGKDLSTPIEPNLDPGIMFR